MSEDLAQDIVRRGDPAEIIAMALNARAKADAGIFCSCPEPVLAGYDLMCGRCLLENVGQRIAREARMNSPHQYEPRPRSRLGMCAVCTGWEEDPRHDVGEGAGHPAQERHRLRESPKASARDEQQPALPVDESPRPAPEPSTPSSAHTGERAT